MNVKRLAIFVVYDKDGIVDDYIPYYLKALRPNVSRLTVVCNGELTDEGRAKLTAVADDVFVRPNVGFDCGAVKDTLFNLIGWETIYQFDELLIANDTVYGPFRPFEQVFGEMDKRNVDVWGLTIQAPTYDWTYMGTKRQEIPDYLQSYFINVKNKALKSESFRNFWQGLDTDNFTFSDAVFLYEHAFTAMLCKEGFTFDAYTDISGFFSDDPANNCTATFFAPLEMMKRYNMPFLKKKALIFDMTARLSFTLDEGPNAVIRYIENETDYDVNLIWDNIIRTSPPDVLTKSMKLRFLIEEEIGTASISRIFKENPRLGVLHTPKPYHGRYYSKFWAEDLEHCKFWIREGLNISGSLAEITEAARQKGYCCGVVETTESAAVRAVDLEYMLAKLCEFLPESDMFFGAVGAVRFASTRNFCHLNKTVYVYGAGGEALRWAEMMRDLDLPFSGFVVSDGQQKKEELLGRKVFYLSDVRNKQDNPGFILALNERNTQEVIRILEQRGFTNYLIVNG